MKKIFITIVITIGVVLFMLSFVEKEDTTNLSIKDGIRVAMYNIPKTFRDVESLTLREQDIICATSIGLVEKNNHGKVMMSLAKEAIKRDGGIEYEFILKEDAKWSNGEKITPDDYIKYLKDILKNSKEEEVKGILDIFGAKDYRSGKITFEKGVAISVNKENYGIIIRLNHKNDNFIEELTKPQYRLRKNLSMWENIRNDYSKLIYSGAYSITYMDKNEIKLTRNDESKKEIEFIKEDNPELAMASFEIKEKDMVLDPPKNELNRLKSENKLYSVPNFKSVYAFLNDKKDRFTLPLRREVYKNLNKAMRDYVNSNQNYYDLAEGCYYREQEEDLTKLQAKRVGINSGADVELPNILTILAEDTTDNRDLCEFIYKWMKVNKNIEVRFTYAKSEEINSEELRKRYNIILTENSYGYANRKDFIESIKQFLGENIKKSIDSGKFDSAQIEDELYESCTLVPLVFYRENIALSSNVKNVEFDGNGNINFQSLK